MKLRALFSSALWLSASGAALCQNNPGTFASTGSMSQARTDRTATLLPNRSVLIAGGQNNSEFLASAEVFDPSLGMFVMTGNMNSSRAFATATGLLNGQVLLAGGQGGKRGRHIHIAQRFWIAARSGTFSSF